MPRPLAVLGLIGGSMAVASAIAELFGAALGIWLIVKGFRPSPVIQDPQALQHAGHSAIEAPWGTPR